MGDNKIRVLALIRSGTLSALGGFTLLLTLVCPPNGPAERTFEGSGHTAIEGNAPCLQAVLGSVCRTVEQQSCPKRQAGSQWGEAEDAATAGLAHHQLLDASARKQGPRPEHRPREHAVVHRRGDALHRPCAQLPPPSS